MQALGHKGAGEPVEIPIFSLAVLTRITSNLTERTPLKFLFFLGWCLQLSQTSLTGTMFMSSSLSTPSRQSSGKGAIRKRFPLQKPRWEKTKLTIRFLYHETIVSRMGSYFPNRWPLNYLNLTKNMKTYIRRQQHKNFLNTKT